MPYPIHYFVLHPVMSFLDVEIPSDVSLRGRDGALSPGGTHKLHRHKGLKGEYYFSINGSDPSDEIFDEMRNKYPKTILHKLSESEGYEFCFGTYIDDGREIKCAPHPLMHARFIAMPLWHVALVSAGTTGSGGQFWVLNAYGRWIVLTGQVGYV
ncbi:hypothetical protein [Nitrospirillum sp. BR 11828]|uniref:hypothetical protein n=1 Tax=Nitrospirillum sp. BR 11828 TaxID=3104325 RepID=UPI002ACA3837|nr:hypothetical protein [Nitrospirillum sp. BR 11828]MDZ5649589.1 hypothetical protein [Nitrospirillum sp. BR 11828]